MGWDRYFLDAFPTAHDGFELFDGRAPLLTDVRLGSFTLLPTCRPLLSNLRHLEMRQGDNDSPGLQITDWKEVLQGSPLLETLAIRGCSSLSPEDSPRAPEVILMEWLTRIELSEMDSENIGLIFATLRLPRLRSFAFSEIENSQGTEYRLSRYLSSENIMAPLQSLTVGSCKCSFYWFYDLLRALPELQELEMASDDNQCISALTTSDSVSRVQHRDSPITLPKLRCLKVTRHGVKDMVGFLNQRRTLGDVTLTDVIINPNRKEWMNERYPLESLRHSFRVRFCAGSSEIGCVVCLASIICLVLIRPFRQCSVG